MTRHFHSVEKSIGVNHQVAIQFWLKKWWIKLVTSNFGFFKVVDPYEGLGKSSQFVPSHGPCRSLMFDVLFGPGLRLTPIDEQPFKAFREFSYFFSVGKIYGL